MAEFTPNYNLKKPAEEDFYDITDQNDNMDKIDEALTPAADPEQAPAGNGPGKLNQWVSWLANRIKSITGTTNWWDNPPTTLQVAKTHIDAEAPHSGHETPDGAQDKADAAEENAKNYADSVGAAAVSAANNYTDQEVGEVEQVLNTHLAEDVTNDDNPHGIIFEEGTWTPEIIGATVPGGGTTYTRQIGRYQRNGNKVLIEADVEIDQVDTTATGHATLSGIPFAPTKVGASYVVVPERGITIGDGRYLVLRPTASGAIRFYSFLIKGGGIVAEYPTIFGNGATFKVTLIYDIS